MRVAYDETAFTAGRSLIESIERGVRLATRLICVLSPDFVESDWTGLEYQMKLLDDPAGRKGLIVPILLRDCDVPYSLRIRLAADFRKKEGQERGYQRLLVALGIGSSPAAQVRAADSVGRVHQTESFTIGYEEPDPIIESLALNAFRVESHPNWLWSGTTTYRTPGEIADKAEGRLNEAFVLNSGKLWTFVPLDRKGTVMRRFVETESIERFPFSEMYAKEMPQSLVIDLLNRTLTFHLKKKDIRYDRRYNRYYFTARYGGPRTVAWPGLKKSDQRTVAVPHLRNGQVAYFKHLAAEMGFRQTAGQLCLYIVPTRMLTENGYEPKRGLGVGTTVGKLTRRLYNNAFWLDVMFWLHQLHSGGRLLVGNRNASIEISSRPLRVQIGNGILADKVSLFDDAYIERWHELTPPLEGGEEEVEDEGLDADSDTTPGEGNE